jgi:hypothetical protein
LTAAKLDRIGSVIALTNGTGVRMRAKQVGASRARTNIWAAVEIPDSSPL